MKRFFKSEFKALYLSCVLMFIALLALGQAANQAHKKASTEDYLRFSNVLSEVYDTIQRRYVDDVDGQKLYEAAIQGMFLSLDDHSQFLNADMYEQLNKETEGNFSGIGIHIGMRSGVLTVISPIPRSPAARAGIQPWDRIIKIFNQESRNITLQEAVSKLTGPVGTTVTISLYRASERRTFNVTITRAQVKVNSVYSKMLDDEIGYARLLKFANDTSGDLKIALINFSKKNAKGIILDLRYNTGGLLKEAIDVSNIFLDKDTVIVSTKGKDASQNQVFKAKHEAVTHLPVIVLVNNASASASEIVAAAIKDNNRGILLGPKGQKTYGKWSVQTIEEMDNSINYDTEGNPRRSAVRLTTARYYSPKGNTYHKEGIPFDEELEIPIANERRLLMEGYLLGDPNMLEPKDTKIDHFPSSEEQKGAAPKVTSDDKKSSNTKEDEDLGMPPLPEDKETTPGAKLKDEGPFHDLLMEYGVKLIKRRIEQSAARKVARG
ncbi:MAG: S41 family peptidase [Candidatus Sumerlaeota bacterium]|nr:S41 family peptidase [Candidatus Sumerlaeota bacterium]